jgi:hypothetical protein
MSAIGYDVENWVCYGMPSEHLTSEQRAAIIDYADSFEECGYTSSEMAEFDDHSLIQVCYQAMAEYARGQM